MAINAYLLENNRRLVLRDYSYIDYLGVPFVDKPSMHSSLQLAISHTRPVLLIRHPLSQYNSLRSHEILRNQLSPTLFIKGYQSFLEHFKEARMIKYEEIVSHPVITLSYLCDYLDLPFSDNFINEFYNNRTITGNFNRINEKTISFSKQPMIEDEWSDQLQNDAQYQPLLETLGYAEMSIA